MSKNDYPKRDRGLKKGYRKRKWGPRIGWGRVNKVPEMVAEEERVSPKWSKQFISTTIFFLP